MRHTVQRQPADLCAGVRAASCPTASVVVTIVAPRSHSQTLRTYACVNVYAHRVIVCGHVKIVCAHVCVQNAETETNVCVALVAFQFSSRLYLVARASVCFSQRKTFTGKQSEVQIFF